MTLIDVHAHFYTGASARADWRELNARRLAAGERIGVTVHVASILGTWGRRSPTYFPSREDVEHANDAMAALVRECPDRVRAYCVVNPNYTAHAVAEIERRVAAGFVGVKLAASRRADDPLLDPVAERAAQLDVPLLQHVWQHRRRDWPGQEASDATELARLAARHQGARFILAHLGGGGDWSHSLRAVREVPNVWVDLSGSGVDPDMLDEALAQLGAGRLVWGADLTLDTGWAKLRYLESLGRSAREVEQIRCRNAQAVFRRGAFDARH